jgi:hypothetical protein
MVLDSKKLLVSFFIGKYSMSNQMSEGQNASFKCSQTDSFTAEKAPTKANLPENSYVKCKALPKKIMKAVPIIS